jgi:hypothetical protein
VLAPILGALPDWLDLDFARTATGALTVAAIVLGLFVLFAVRSAGVRIFTVVFVGAAVFGLLHYRSTLDRCDKRGCACTFFGEDLRGGGCLPSP